MSEPNARKKRSITMCAKLAKKKNLEVEFDGFSRPIGKTATQFRSYTGLQTRTMIPLTHPDWHKVPETEKEQLWLTIKGFWNIEDNTNKDGVLKICNQAWKSFKKNLINKYLKKGENPVSKYEYMDDSQWQEFIPLKLTKEFQEKSERGRENAKKNTNPARLGSCGYSGKVDHFQKQIESGEVSEEISQIQNIQAVQYLMARQERVAPGVYMLPSTLQPLANAIVEKDRQLSQGEWVPGPGEDPLIAILGPEHPGRTRGVGHNIGLKKSIHGIIAVAKYHAELGRCDTDISRPMTWMHVEWDIGNAAIMS